MLTYDPRRVEIIYGTKRLTGMADDDMVTIEPLGDGAVQYVGADGEVARSMDPNRTYKITVNLASTSKSNDYLSKVYNLDRKTGNGILPLMVKDLSGTTLFSAEEAYIANYPQAKKGREVDGQEWVFNTGNVDDPILGGNE